MARFATSKVFESTLKAYNTDVRYILNKGATRSTKSYSILQLLYLIAKSSPRPLLISIVSETMPHLKKGCIRDFNKILQGVGDFNERNINKTDNVYKINKSQIEFFSCDAASKVHGPQRDILYINECNNVSYDVFTQLNIRTSKKVFLDYNPVTRFWADKQIMELLPSSEWTLIHSTYLDNPFLSREQVKAIEARKSDADWWNVYGLGITGGRSGLVYDAYDVVHADSWPTRFTRECVGLDFGFSVDPTAAVHVGFVDGAIWVRELLFEQGLTNPDIARLLHNYAAIDIIADSAEQKSIEELRRLGLRTRGCTKGGGSIAAGITTVRKYPIKIHAASVNVIDEMDSYRYRKSSDGEIMAKPVDKFNHAMDAMRYAVCDGIDRGNTGGGASFRNPARRI